METPESTKIKPVKNKKTFLYRLLINLGAMALVACVLGWIALKWLDVWTDHGHYELVPDVKGISCVQAIERLEAAGFKPEISDSIYDNRRGPGIVMEQNPKVNTKVKEGRVVYLTITAFSPKMVTLPSLTDISVRQARSILVGLGIKHINVVEVPSDFKDLVLAVKCNGVRLSPGARIPVTSEVVLEVGGGIQEMTDSVLTEEVDLDQLDIF